MNCEEYQQQVSRLLDNALGKEKMADLFRHLGECEECRVFFGTSMQLRQAMRSAVPMQVPESVDGEVLGFAASRQSAVSDAAPQPFGLSNHTSRISIRTVALAVLVLVIGCVMFSTTISIDTQGASPSAFQTIPANGAR